MPSSKNYVRDYSSAGEGKYDKSSKRMEDNRKRKKARYKLEQAGIAKRGDGKDVDQIWQEMGVNPAPDILFFLANPSAGESITMIGIAVGVSSVVPATFFSAYFLNKSRNPVFAIVAILAGLLTCVAMTGIIL